MDAVLIVAAETLPSIHASTALLGCAKLGLHPGRRAIQACWEAVVRGGEGDPQGVANAAWALAVLEVSLVWDLAYPTPVALTHSSATWWLLI